MEQVLDELRMHGHFCDHFNGLTETRLYLA